LQASIEKIGLRTPITVRMMDADAISEPMLVSGLHRLEAAKAIGWQQIECFVVDHESDDEARMWEIAENLHRSELVPLERDEHIAEWVRLSDKLSEKGRPGKSAHAARELGINERDVQRAVKVDSLTPEAKQAAREVGLDDNRSALLEAARVDPEKQADYLRQRSTFKPAADPLEDVGALEKQVASLMNAWNNAGPDARQEFLCRIGASL
jgi:ParB-like chromosome segregation protein Spo0J